MNRPYRSSRPLLALAGVLALALAVSGCGRKGPLESPAVVAVPPGPDGAPPPPPPPRTFILDPLLN